MSAIAARITTRSWGWGPMMKWSLLATLAMFLLFGCWEDIDPRDR